MGALALLPVQRHAVEHGVRDHQQAGGLELGTETVNVEPRHTYRGPHWTACRRCPENRWYRAQGTARSASLQAQAAPAAYRVGCRE